MKRSKERISPEEVSRTLEMLASTPTEDSVRKIWKSAAEGTQSEQDVRRMLAWFCERAKEIPDVMHEASLTPSLVLFVAWRISRYLDGSEPDLMHAFGLTKKGRGRKNDPRASERRLIAAARVHARREAGETLEKAQAAVAEECNMAETSVRDAYSKLKDSSELKMRRLYEYLLHPHFIGTKGS